MSSVDTLREPLERLVLQQEMSTYSGVIRSGHSVEIIKAEENHSFTLNESALEGLLLDARVKNRKVIVLSIAGAFRKGKSFLLNFFLRYLKANGSKNWIGNPDASLEGFSWKGGSERDTSGILMWSEPFEVTLPSGERACVLLMDTQGIHDCRSTIKDCATVFALSTMLSSVQVYNIGSNIQEDYLQHLEFFTEYGRLALASNESKPFQNLHILVRDWQCPYEHEYGWKGGETLLAKRLQITSDQPEELQQLRLQLCKCFARIGCCLMPYPGSKVATNPHFDGCMSDIDEEFKICVQDFVSSILSPESLVVKKIFGREITGKELVEYFKAYIRIFQGNELPEPKSVFEMTAKANNLAAVEKAKDLYRNAMEEVCRGYRLFISYETTEREHNRCKQEAVQLFHSFYKMGGKEMSQPYLEQLIVALDEMYASYIDWAKNREQMVALAIGLVAVGMFYASKVPR